MLVLASSLITGVAVVWVATYSALGLYLSGAIPLAYQVMTVLNLGFSPGPSGTGSSAPVSWHSASSFRSCCS
jgi:hypothetical protein